MTTRRYLIGCLIAAVGVTAAALGWTVYSIRETGRAHRRAKGDR